MDRRTRIFKKYDGKCAYSGTPLEDDWQPDHVRPIFRNGDGTCRFPNDDCEENMVPCQKAINHYKRGLTLEEFRDWYLAGLHKRIGKPKNPRTEKSKKKKEYLQKVASYFGITENKPFSGVFYFETLKEQK